MRAEDFLILDVAAGDGQLLRAEAEFADLAGDRIGCSFAGARRSSPGCR